MTFSRNALCALVLCLGGAAFAPGAAQAGNGTGGHMKWHDIMSTGHYLRVMVGNDPTNPVAAVEVSVSSDAGDEDLRLTESDAWLHGAAALAKLPVKDAALTVTVYDEGSAARMTFSGTLATDGTVTLAAGEPVGPCEIGTKLGCTTPAEYDVEVLAAEVYASGKGYALTLDLAGADTYEVAYAKVEVTGGEKAEVAWEAVGSVWEAEATLEHSGEIHVQAKARGATGGTLENIDAELAEPWLDAGGGVSALSVSAGTSVALHRWSEDAEDGKNPGTWSGSSHVLTVVSDGWNATTYPTHAEIELAGGGTVTVPANSYQRRGELFKIGDEVEATVLSIDRGERIRVSRGKAVLFELTTADVDSPVCSEGLCATLVAHAAGGYGLDFTAYGEKPAALADKDTVVVDELSDDVVAEERVIRFDAGITAVFASELAIEGDPIGGDASGEVSLLGAANPKGKQATLSKGAFYGRFSRDGDGDLALGGYGTDDWATTSTSADVALGDPVVCGAGSGCDGGPPVIQYGVGGKVTKIVVSSGGLGYSAY